ncbi:MAG: HTH-type transcriptional regulator CysB, partial [Betaproteobacteria bacterium]|nr:HTH-type transcriptional regulator CysB [Betaproteobacteria bacterium]
VLTATDADVIKAYVAAGLGVAVVQTSVYDKKKDTELRAVDVSRFFQPGPGVLMMRRQVYLSGLVRDFIKVVIPEIDLTKVTDTHEFGL